MSAKLTMIYWKPGSFWLGKLREHPDDLLLSANEKLTGARVRAFGEGTCWDLIVN
jgi:hypothetical protein